MNKGWPLVPLGGFLTERREIPSEEGLTTGEIPIIAKIGFEDGQIQLRSDCQTKTGMILIRPGDLVVSGINAAKGAISVYGEENSIPIAATIHYAAYIPNKGSIDISFLWWLLRSRTFKDLLLEFVPDGIKTELKAKRLLPIPIPLPPLPEQQRIVARIEALTRKTKEARELEKNVAAEQEALVISTHLKLSGKRTRLLGEIVELNEEQVSVLPNEQYPQVGVKGFGGGLFAKPSLAGTETTYRVFNRLYDGALVLSQVKAWEGAIAICEKDLAGWYVSPEYRTFRCIPNESLPGYLSAIVRTEWFWSKLIHATRGVGARRERTRPEQFLSIRISMPDVGHQKEGEELYRKVDALKELQAKTAAELDALLPSILDKAFKGQL